MPGCHAQAGRRLHATRVHDHDLVVETGEAALVLGDEQRLEGAIAIARHRYVQRAVVGQYRLAALAVAVVAGRLTPLLATVRSGGITFPQ